MKHNIYRKYFDNGFKERLNYLMKEKEIGVKELSIYIGVNKVIIKQWITKDLDFPTYSYQVNRLCKFFKVKSSWLMKGYI